MIEDLILIIHIRVNPFNDHFSKSAAHLFDRFAPVLRMDDQLRQHGIIVGRHCIAAVNSRIDTDALSSRQIHICDRSRRRTEVLLRIFRIDPALNGMPRDMDVFLSITQSLSVRNTDLFLDQVNACHPFGDRMLHLDPGIHLHEIKISVLLQKELNRPGICIMSRFCRLHCRLSHLLSQFRRQCDRGGLFDHFLMIPLD